MTLSEGDWQAIGLSLKVAAAAVAVGLPLALLAAQALVRLKPPTRAALEAVVQLPLVLPPVATGFVLLLLFGREGVIGASLARIGVVFAFDWTGAALAAGVMAFPLMVRPIRLSIEAIDREVGEAAVTLGAGPLVRFVRLTVPLAAPGLVAGAVLGFAKALGEFGATITFAGAIPGETLTLPTAIWGATQSPGGDGRALALCLISAALALVATLAAEAVSRASARWAKP
jgi:molybdate transport system permease protein